MEDTPSSTGLLDPPEAPHKARNRRILIAVAVTIVTALTLSTSALFVLRDNDTAAPGPSAPPSPTVGSVVTTTPTAAPSEPSAIDALAPFLSAAATLDGQLKEAAAAINRSGPPWTTNVGPEVARLVKAAELEPVAQTIPAGLPPDLLRSVILVYSDLASRRGAMTAFEYEPPSPFTGTLLSELGLGHAAAARFDADLAATRALAAATPPIADVPPDSRLVAEKLLLIQDVNRSNFCNERGGAVFTSLPEITWGAPSWNPNADGTIGRPGFTIDFTAEFRDGTWEVYIIAC